MKAIYLPILLISLGTAINAQAQQRKVASASALARQNQYVPPNTLVNACSNLDFESGNFSNWTMRSGYNTTDTLPLTIYGSFTSPASTGTNDDIFSCNDVTLITAAYGNDPFGFFPGVSPTGGTTSVRLGGRLQNLSSNSTLGVNCYFTHHSALNADGQSITQTFVISAANALITYDYAVVLNNDVDDTPGRNSYFRASVKDSVGKLLSACTVQKSNLLNGVPQPGFIQVGTGQFSKYYYQPWHTNSFNLTPYIGRTVTLQFEAAGCNGGKHEAWAYVDASCGPAEPTLTVNGGGSNPCLGNSATLTAPNITGATYTWAGPGIVGDSTKQIATINVSGTYIVTVTPHLVAVLQ